MNHKPNPLTNLPGLTMLGVVAVVLAIAMHQAPASSADEKAVPPDTAATDEKTPLTDAVPSETPPADASAADPATQEATAASADVPNPTELLNQVRSKLQSLDSLRCDLHQTVMMSGMTLRAAGTYAEASGNRVHVEFRIFPSQPAVKDDTKKLTIDAEPAPLAPETSRGELTQVSDGTVLFTLWKNGATVRVTRRNLRDIMAAATQVSGYDADHVAMDLGVGGLRGLISRIESLMEFAPVQTKKVGDSDFFVVRGRWNAKTRKELFQLPDDVIADPRPHVPEYVVFYIDAKTLLPRRIEYRKRAADPAQKFDRPMVTLDLRNVVLNETLPDDMFVFAAPEGVKEEDITELTIQSIQQTTQAPAATETPATSVPATETPK
ncbi:MAG: hypothetical protein WKF77_21140 [Planctomycetaceae bacterium]